jgi:hypothetical protein
MDRAPDQLGAFGYRAVVHVTQCQHRAVWFGQPGQHAFGNEAVQLGVPVVHRVDRLRQFGHRHGEPIMSTSVMIGELVPCHPDQPRHADRRRIFLAGSIHRREKGFRGQIFRGTAIGAATNEVPVHHRQRLVIQRKQRPGGVVGVR